ncbi:MAG: transcription repressor NadR [Eubacteriales bacterium]|nr:transcription repressor NadR [Eubacteriales bacterium]
MKGERRRQELIRILKRSTNPVSGNTLAEGFNVSRQIIVQDIALLRAADFKILSTNKGYILDQDNSVQRIFKIYHSDEEIRDELYTIVDAGGRVLDVFINHEIYGQLKAELLVYSRSDVDEFVTHLSQNQISPLKQLTNGFHYHTVEADTEKILDRIEADLKNKKYLIE